MMVLGSAFASSRQVWQQYKSTHCGQCAPAARRNALSPRPWLLYSKTPGCFRRTTLRRHLQPPHVCQAQASAASTSLAEAKPAGSDHVKAVLFDMDGVLTNSEEISREVGADVLKELYNLDVKPEEFIPFVGQGEANFLGGVANKYNAPFDVDKAKAKFFEIYIRTCTQPGVQMGYPGALQLIKACKEAGLRIAVASSADRVKVDANLLAAGIDQVLFDAVVSADLFERLKPAPDIFLAAAEQLGVPPRNCVVIEDAAAGVQAARAAGMRCIAVTTTLSEADLQREAADTIRPDISRIALSDITDLAPPPGRPATASSSSNGSGNDDDNGVGGSAAAARSATAASTSSSNDAAQGGWLEQPVSLPGGYSTTRRELLKFGSLGVSGAAAFVFFSRAKTNPSIRSFLLQYHIPLLVQLGIFAYVARTLAYWQKAMSFASLKAVLTAVLPRAAPPQGAEGAERVAAFKRFIADVERRGGGEQVPEFPPGLEWLNAPPLKLSRELAGKVLILDFWTYCCINCMHVLPDLAYLEAKYSGQPVAVVGVHSAKFDNEKDSDAIRNAVIRYDITHPVVNDGGMVLWRALGVSSWPTLALVSPAGRLIAMLAGEGHRGDLNDLLAAALQFYGERGQLSDTPVPQALERDKDPRLASSQLRYPGKVATDLAGNRLFIADSNNNRIIITNLQGRFLEQVGSGAGALLDGSFAEAAFRRPQGVAYSAARDAVYVADTENHAVREVDLSAKRVRTLAGNGVKGGDYVGGKRGRQQQLNSPWDVVVDPQDPGSLFIAMAGQHQVWRYDGATGAAAVFSGDGYERNQNGGSGPSTSWAQPSGLTAAPGGDGLFVADSESSTVRSLSLDTGGGRAHVGGDPMFSDNLFRFGDRDGSGSGALLQHPLAVCALPDGRVAVADSYNHRIKLLAPATNTITTIAGSGAAGFKDGVGKAAQFSEPGGLALGPPGSLIVADTNNSVLRSLDLATGAVKTLDLSSVPPLRVSPTSATPADAVDAGPPPGAAVVRVAPVAAASGQLRLSITLPPGYHLTRGANSGFTSQVVGPAAAASSVELEPAKGSFSERGGGLAAAVAFSSRASVDEQVLVRLNCKVYFCEEEQVCLFEEVSFEVPLAAGAGGAGVVALEYAVSAKAPVVTLPGL